MQLDRVEKLISRKRQIFECYDEELGDMEGVSLNYEASYTKNTLWMVTVVIDEKFRIRKNRLMELMSERNIDCRPFYHPSGPLPV